MGAILDKSTVAPTTLTKPGVEDFLLKLNYRRTPYFGTVKKAGNPGAVLYGYPVEVPPDGDTTPQADGTDIADSDATDFHTATYQDLLYARPHILREVARTGRVANLLINRYGQGKLHAKTVMTKMELLKWRAEKTMMGGQDSYESASGGKTTYQTRGMHVWTGGTRHSGSADTAAAIPSLAAIESGARINLGTSGYSAFTETNLRAIFQAIFEGTGSEVELTGYMTPNMKSHLTTILGATYTPVGSELPLRHFNSNAESESRKLKVTRFESDFGNSTMVPTMAMPSTAAASGQSPAAYFIDREFWQMNVVEAIHHENKEDNGGGPKTLLQTCFFHTCRNPKRNGVAYKTNAA